MLSHSSWVFTGEDYSIASSDVVLLEGETTKAVPVYIINDIYPELEEAFLVQLLNETTGGARLGPLREAVITIGASDDPCGLFGNHTHLFISLTLKVTERKVTFALFKTELTKAVFCLFWFCFDFEVLRWIHTIPGIGSWLPRK